VAGAVSIPVIGIGGIMSPDDALEFLLAGARAVQVGTANYVRPQAVRQIRDGIEAHMAAHGWATLDALPLRVTARV
jgi:dihydroorotate dehydrogenase (NAD+) catalytic subunit